jgi:hypothetical protein
MSQRVIPYQAKSLQKAQDLIRDRKDWCRGTYHDETGLRFCAVGACQYADEHEWPRLEMLLNMSAYELYFSTVVTVNDIMGHAAVMTVFDHAINRLIQEANTQ